MSELELALDALLADPLARTRAAGNGLGFVGSDVPLDLLLATGRPVAHLPWIADRETPRAAQWMEDRFAGWAHSILEDWARGVFDALADVVFTRGNDSAQRLYYYVCELQRTDKLRGPRPLFFDAAYVPRDTSRVHMTAALRRLGGQLGVDDAALRVGIERANARRAQIASWQSGRKGQGPLYEKLFRASLVTDVAPLLAANPLPAEQASGVRVLLAGSVPPDGRLHCAVEAGGGSIVAEHHEYGVARLGPAIDAQAVDPFDAVVRQRRLAPIVGRGFGDAAAMLRSAAEACRAEAVVLWLTADDESRAWHVPAQRAALEAAELPSLVLTARHWAAGDGALDEITAFTRTIR